jgi:hypothetical protein
VRKGLDRGGDVREAVEAELALAEPLRLGERIGLVDRRRVEPLPPDDGAVVDGEERATQ